MTLKRPLLVFISQPMNGRSRDAIDRERALIMDELPLLLGEPVEEIPSVFDNRTVTKMHPLYCVGMSLQLLSAADVAIFAEGWEEARGCRIEHECALQYGIRILDLSDGQHERTLEES